MMRKTFARLDKLIVVESPNKVIKIEGLLSDPECIQDWSFNDTELKRIGVGPEKVHAVATTGHFMGLTEINWCPQTAPGASSRMLLGGKGAHNIIHRGGAARGSDDEEPFPLNGTLASFSLEWETLPGRKVAETVSRYIEKMGDTLTEIILATDPDREGELIAVHTLNLIQSLYPDHPAPFSRAYIHSITAAGVQKAMRERQIRFCDYDLANAAETRHAMDRMFGYLGSSVTRAANQQMRSIGRVQTPALILICDRENKIASFVDEHKPVYVVEATCTFPVGGSRGSSSNAVFMQRVTVEVEEPAKDVSGRDMRQCTSAEEAEKNIKSWQLERSRGFTVPPGGTSVTQTTVLPPRPFTMATLIAQANRQLRMSSEAVSTTLQDLFQLGYITYPRTDSTRIDAGVLPSIYNAVSKGFGQSMVYTAEERAADEEKEEDLKRDASDMSGNKDATFKRRGGNGASKRKQRKDDDAEMNVEDAHEAIRPTDIDVDGEALSLNRQAKLLYELIRTNTLASFMVPMKSERVSTTVSFLGGGGTKLCFKLGGKRTVEPGWTTALSASKKSSKAPAPSAGGAAGEEEGAGGNGHDEGGLDEGENCTDELDQAVAAAGGGGCEGEEAAFVEKDGVRQAVVQNLSNDEFQGIASLSTTLKSGGASRGSYYASSVKLRFPSVTECRAIPPPPLSEGSLIEELKNHGVGRPSTYPTIVRTLLQRGYISVIDKGRCASTPLGRQLVSTASATFPSLINIGFTASFEKKLDAIAKPSTVSMPAMVRGTSLSQADYVLSHFLSTILTYITDATRLQRTQIVERTMKLRHEQRKQEEEELNFASTSSPSSTSFNSANAVSDAEFEQALHEAKEKVAQSVPDFATISKTYRNFTALQRGLYEYLRKNFPPVHLSVAQSGSGVTISEHPIPPPKSLHKRQTYAGKKSR